MRRLLYLLLVTLVALVGCKPIGSGGPVGPSRADYARPLPDGLAALRKLTNPADIPDFSVASGQTADLRAGIAASLRYMAKPSSQEHFPYRLGAADGVLTHQRVVDSLRMFDRMLEAGLTGPQINAVIWRCFDVYTSVGWNGMGGVLFTGYYTPIFDASPVRTERFRFPLYETPTQLAKGPVGEILGVRLPTGKIVPCPSRRHMRASGLLTGRELVWLADPFEVYIAHVQGSARLRMPDGRIETVGYAASNGHPYRSVATELVRDGRMAPDKVSLQKMIEFFRRNPQLIATYVQRNPRFVFFTRCPGLPRGSLNEPVTPMRSIATDKSVYPRAALTFVRVDLPQRQGGQIHSRFYEGFALDQDTGGAIRAPGRCDMYIGVGDEAAELAGRTLAEGRLYYLFVKDEAETELMSRAARQAATTE